MTKSSRFCLLMINIEASLCYALTFVLMNWLVGYVLYRKKIFIKL